MSCRVCTNRSSSDLMSFEKRPMEHSFSVFWGFPWANGHAAAGLRFRKTKRRRLAAPPFRSQRLRALAHEQREKDNDRQRDSQEPQQRATSKAHLCLLDQFSPITA